MYFQYYHHFNSVAPLLHDDQQQQQSPSCKTSIPLLMVGTKLDNVSESSRANVMTRGKVLCNKFGCDEIHMVSDRLFSNIKALFTCWKVTLLNCQKATLPLPFSFLHPNLSTN